MDSKIIAAIIGVGGVSVGALLGGLGYYLKSRNETQQTIKLVLYHLLELRHLLKSSYADPKEITEEYLNYCMTFFQKRGMTDEGKFPEALKTLIEKHFADLLSAMKPRIDGGFIHSYEDALKELCKTDPVLAFKLRGRERISEILEVQSEYIESVTADVQVASSNDFNQLLQKQMDDAGSKVLLELIQDIDNEISLVAWKCSPLTWAKCTLLTLKKTKPVLNFKEAGLDNMLEEIVNNTQVHGSNN